MLRPLVRPLVRALTRSPMESRGLRPTLSLDFTNGGVTDSRVTYSGGANGTRVNSAGLIVAATTPRFDYNPVTLAPLGFLVEEARTNLILRSDNFDHAAWDKANSTSVGNAWGGVAGDSLKLLLPAAATSVVAGGIYSSSFEFKNDGARFLQVIFDDTATANGVWTSFDLQTGTITQPATAFGTGASAASTTLILIAPSP